MRGVREEVEPADVDPGWRRLHHQERGSLLDLRDIHGSGGGSGQWSVCELTIFYAIVDVLLQGRGIKLGFKVSKNYHFYAVVDVLLQGRGIKLGFKVSKNYHFYAVVDVLLQGRGNIKLGFKVSSLGVFMLHLKYLKNFACFCSFHKYFSCHCQKCCYNNLCGRLTQFIIFIYENDLPYND